MSRGQNKTGYRGVSRLVTVSTTGVRHFHFIARVYIGHQKYIGTFKTATEAGKAVLEYEARHGRHRSRRSRDRRRDIGKMGRG